MTGTKNPSPQPNMTWVEGIESAPYASTVLAAYFDGSVGEWIVQLFVADRPSAPFTHWMHVARPNEAPPQTTSTLSPHIEGDNDGGGVC